MLRAMRNSAENWLIKALVGVLFALLVLSFALWGIGDIFRDPAQEQVVARVGDLKVSGQEFTAQYRRQTAEIQRLLGDGFDAEKGRQLGFVNQVASGLVNRALFNNAANALGLTVGASFIKQRILEDPAFQGDVGQFSEILFRQALYESGYTEDSYVEGTRQDLAREQLLDVFQRGAVVPKTMLDPLLKSRRERRSADTITIDVDTVEGFDQPNGDELKRYFSEREGDFQSPELRDLSYIHVEAEDLLDQIDIAEETLRELYDERIGVFTVPEERKLRQILFDDRASAEQAMKMINQGKDFASVAKEVAGLEEADINLGWNQRADILNELADAVFTGEEGGVAGPVESPFGWHIVRIDEVKAENIVSFDEARGSLRNNYAREEALDTLYELINQTEDSLAGGATLEELAENLGRTVEKTQAISERGQTLAGEAVDNLPPDPFLSRAFRMAADETSETIETGDNGFLVIRVERVDEPRQLSFAEAEDRVRTSWIREKQRETARETANFIAEQINQGGDIETLSQNYGLEVVGKQPFTRDGAGGTDLPLPLIGELFTLEQGQAAAGEGNQVFIVAQVAEILPVGGDREAEDRAEVSARLRSDIVTDLLSQYSGILRERYDIKVYDSVIDSLL